MLGNKKCRVILAYGNYRVGDVIYPVASFRQVMVARGFIEIVAETAESASPIETATAEPDCECAVMPAPIKRKRGRPKGSKNKPRPIVSVGQVLGDAASGT